MKARNEMTGCNITVSWAKNAASDNTSDATRSSCSVTKAARIVNCAHHHKMLFFPEDAKASSFTPGKTLKSA